MGRGLGRDRPKGRYIPEELADLIAAKLVPLAGVITPNAFEAQYLTGLPLNSPQQIVQVVNHLHRMGPGRILITSVMPEQQAILYNVASDGQEIVLIQAPRFKGQVHGAGDMLGASLATLLALGYEWLTAACIATAIVTRAVGASLEQGLDTVDPYQGILGKYYSRPYKLSEDEVQEMLNQVGIVTHHLV